MIIEINVKEIYAIQLNSTFSQEVSTLGIKSCSGLDSFKVINHKTGGFRIFQYNRTIYVGNGEKIEIGAWEYKNDEGHLLTILNDKN